MTTTPVLARTREELDALLSDARGAGRGSASCRRWAPCTTATRA